MEQTVIAVSGMTCEHCVRAVQEEIGRIDGVQRVEVDLTSGSVTIDAEPLPEQAALRAAVDAAGYVLAG
ncbi:MAG TPA: cation transporter [Streptosporangiaceae bacterium]|nr:cation transporter [Streptosporangiaceae bacterium]